MRVVADAGILPLYQFALGPPLPHWKPPLMDAKWASCLGR